MAAQAGPSNPVKSRKARPKTRNIVHSGKAKKLSEKQQIASLEKAALEFVGSIESGCFALLIKCICRPLQMTLNSLMTSLYLNIPNEVCCAHARLILALTWLCPSRS